MTIEEKILAPDGVEKPMLVVNGQYPGPTIEGDWGDWMGMVMRNRGDCVLTGGRDYGGE